MPKTRNWPRELCQPMSEEKLRQRGAPLGLLLQAAETPEDRRARLIKNYLAEIKNRASTMLNFFDLTWPENDPQWLSFVMKLCNHWEIPGFQITEVPSKGPGAPKKWTDHKNCELFADVNALVRQRGLSEHSACQYIAAHLSRFGNRYAVKPSRKRRSANDGKTLHRQYERVKKQIQTDDLFRLLNFGSAFDSPNISYGPDLITAAIKRYSAMQEL